MTRALANRHSIEHTLRELEATIGYERQATTRREREIARRHDDAPGVSGDQALSVLEKSLIIRTSETRAIQVWTIDGHRQFTIGTEDEADGGEPFATISEDLDNSGYRAKLHGRLGHFNAPAGWVTTATHNFSRRSSGVAHDPGAASLSTWGTLAWTADTPTSADTTTGAFASWTTTASTGNARGPNGPTAYLSSWETQAYFHILTGADITNTRLWVILGNGDPSGSSTPNLEFAGFRYNTPDTTWKSYVGDGASRTSEDTGITVAANTRYNLSIRLFASQAQMIIGIPEVTDAGMSGTWTSILTTTLPDPSILLAPYVRITTLANEAKQLRFSHANFISR